MKSCFFIGHREAERELLPLIMEAAEHFIQENQNVVFYTGRYGNFDHLAGEAVVQLRKKYPDLRLYMVIPYHPAERPIEAPLGYDGTFYPDGMETVTRRYAIPHANRKMIEMCTILIMGIWTHRFICRGYWKILIKRISVLRKRQKRVR